MKYLIAAATLLAMSPALAQQAPGTDTATQNMARAGESNKFMTKEAPNQWLVGNLWNKNVHSAQGKSIGDLKDVLVGPDGKIQALVIGVGGFLGLGEKNVAVDYDYIIKNGSIGPNRITLNMTEQDLRSAPSFARTSNSNGSNR